MEEELATRAVDSHIARASLRQGAFDLPLTGGAGHAWTDITVVAIRLMPPCSMSPGVALHPLRADAGAAGQVLGVRNSELIRQPQEFLDTRVSQFVPDTTTILASPYVATPAQTGQVSRDPGLGQVEQVNQLAHRAFPVQEQLEDAQPRRVAKPLEKARAGLDRDLGLVQYNWHAVYFSSVRVV